MSEDKKTTSEEHGFEKVVMAAVGAIAKTVETAGELIEEFVKKGEDFFQHGKAVNEELKHKRKESKSDETKGE